MKLSFRLIILTVLAAVATPGIMAQVYATGGFNSWKVMPPAAFTKGADGIYSLDIDFSQHNTFKLSTQAGKTGNGWSEFDAGILSFDEPIVGGKWLKIKRNGTLANNIAPVSRVLTVRVDLDNMRAMVGTAEQVETWSGTLPVMFINTEGGAPIVSKDDYVSATYYIDPMGVEGVEAIGTPEAPLTTQIKGRGNYTWVGFDKKPYRVKLADKQPLLGMPKSKHWALLAHADDNTGFMRNFTGMTASELLKMPWTPQSQPLEVVLNGDYIGLYFLTQTIRVDKDRVNIVEQADLATTDVDGGWLVEIDNYDSDPHVTIYENGSEHPVWFTYKSPEELSAEQEQYLTSQMQAIDDAVYKSPLSDISRLAALVDLDVLARFYITQEILDDTESFHGSCYLNRQRGAAEKWKFGPCWDFGNGMIRQNSQKFIYQDPAFSQVWIGGICRFGDFQDIIRRVWREFLSDNGPEQLQTKMSDFATRISAAAVCDAERWPLYGHADEQKLAAESRRFVSDRIDWLKTQWGKDGVEDILYDADSDAPVEYYTVSGVRVSDTPAPGLYIRRQGSSITKILVR